MAPIVVQPSTPKPHRQRAKHTFLKVIIQNCALAYSSSPRHDDLNGGTPVKNGRKYLHLSKTWEPDPPIAPPMGHLWETNLVIAPANVVVVRQGLLYLEIRTACSSKRLPASPRPCRKAQKPDRRLAAIARCVAVSTVHFW